MERAFIFELKERLVDPAKFIQIILGPRQVGKTTGVMQLQKLCPDKKITYVSSDSQFTHHQEWLKEEWMKANLEEKSAVLIIDEIQLINGWSQIIKALWDENKRKKKLFHVILLGSISMDIHQGLSESLAGRFELTTVSHWSFLESKKLLPKLSLEQYLKLGGYPEPIKMKDEQRALAYVQTSIIDAVITKDILQNVTVKKPALFRQCFELACSYGGQVMSYNKILGQLQEGGNVDLVKYYLSLFEKAFLIKCLEKFSGNILKKKASSPKMIPLAMAFMEVFGPTEEGRKLEVAVGQILLQNFASVFYWQDKQNEVDFIIKKGKSILAIEVKSGRKRERQGLSAFSKKYPAAKTLLISKENFLDLIKLVSHQL